VGRRRTTRLTARDRRRGTGFAAATAS
jgi:hypothetical protein